MARRRGQIRISDEIWDIFDAASILMANPVTTPVSSPALDMFARLVRAHSAVTRLLSAQLQVEHGLTINAYEALLRLSRAEGDRMRRIDLAESLLLTASGITRLLDGLERAGYVANETCDTDRRVSYPVLTDAGRAKLLEAQDSHIASVRALLGERYSDEELTQLIALLDRLPGVDPGTTGEDCTAGPAS
jgi:DNA-binding MarR family transcriptional regulator